MAGVGEMAWRFSACVVNVGERSQPACVSDGERWHHLGWRSSRFGVLVTVITETFTGSNGSAAPSPWVATTLGGVQNIQSNKWHIVNGDSYVGTALTYGTSSYTDVDVTVEITMDAAGWEQYPGVGVRLSGGTNGWATYAEPYNGYIAYLDILTDHVWICTFTSGMTATMDNATINLHGGFTYKLRFQALGTTLRCKAWRSSQSEPGSWMVSIMSSTYTSGKIGFRDQSPSNAATSDWDNFVFDDGVAGGGDKLGVGVSDLDISAVSLGTRETAATATSDLVLAQTAEGFVPGGGGGGAAVISLVGV